MVLVRTTETPDTLLPSRTLRAPMPDKQVECPECGDTLSERGFYGHSDLKHGWSTEQARHYIETGEAPADSGAEAGSAAPAEAAASEPAPEAGSSRARNPEAGPDRDELDRALAAIARNAERQSKIEAVRELRDDRDRGRTAFEDVIADVGADALRDALTGDGDGGLTESDVRAAVREEMDREGRAVADGYGDWRLKALESDADLDTVRELAELESGGGLADAVGTLADRVAGSQAGDTLATAIADVGSDRLADALRSLAGPDRRAPREYREYRETRERADSAGPAGATGTGPSRPAEMPEPDHGRPEVATADASGREVRRADERPSQGRFDRVAGRSDPDPDAGAVVDDPPHQKDGEDGGEADE